MTENSLYIPILTKSGEIFLKIIGEKPDTIIEISDFEAELNGESRFQIKEGCFYEYIISDKNYSLKSNIKDIVKQSNINTNSGRISPNNYVGTLILKVYDFIESIDVRVEVISIKTTYREDYRIMLSEITEKCTDLLLTHTSPVIQNFEPDFNKDSKTLYQQFTFLKSILDSEEFNDSFLKVLSAPVTRWREIESDSDIRKIRKPNNRILKQLTSLSNRIDLPQGHSLSKIMSSVPYQIRTTKKTETVDTPENRFVKYVLNSFLSFIGYLRTKINANDLNILEITKSEEKLEQHLSNPIFREISELDTLPFNSPVLQRKEGYREILRSWLMFNLAAKLIWHGGNDVYEAGKRDVAVLYEYWLFFKLLEIIKDIFKLESKSLEDLIVKTEDGLGLQLKQGNHIAVKGIYQGYSRKLNIEFSYNRTFSGDQNYPKGGSWTRRMRPDYTLTIWPYDIVSQTDAENEELIVHIHFDAKYKIEDLSKVLSEEIDLNEEKNEQNRGTYKRVDLLKMHSYKDAIRRTGGAYILYPGDQTIKRRGFHEIIPGLGAFPIRPSKTDTGENELKSFIKEVVDHFMNRASQRERIAYRTYEIFRDKNSEEVRELLPETHGKNRDLLPNDIFVLVGYYKNQDQLSWIKSKHLYNTRIGFIKGSIHLSSKVIGARYLLLHTYNETNTSKLFKLKINGPRIFSREDLIEINYPAPNHNFYLVFEIEDQLENEFRDIYWDITKLNTYSRFRGSPLPFSVSLAELMNVVIK